MSRDEIAAAMADIVLPPAPDWRPAIAVGAAIAVVAIALAAWRIQQRARRACSPVDSDAVAHLDELHQAWAARVVDDREAGYRLAALLRVGLGLRQLRSDSPPRVVTDPNEWANILTLLEHLRYRRRADTGLSSQVFGRARRWLSAPSADGEGQAP